MVVPRPEEEFGPMIDFREHSFMDNPRLPAAVNASRVTVRICEADDASGKCADGSAAAAATDGVVQLKPGLTDAQLKTALQVTFGDVRVFCCSKCSSVSCNATHAASCCQLQVQTCSR